ncbi:MAG: peroxiredoxin, partial [Muribaculum sp.]|nr:peroxiredoxin [Muribaculum sp.]
MKITAIVPLALMTLMAVASCDRQAKWSVSGEIDGADNARLKIERAENGVWLTLDTLSTDSKGKFKYSRIPLG